MKNAEYYRLQAERERAISWATTPDQRARAEAQFDSALARDRLYRDCRNGTLKQNNISVRYDSGSLDTVTKTSSGGLRVTGRVGRVGILDYDTHKEFRPEDEAFKGDSLASLEDAPLTLNHPPGLVKPEDFEKYAIGHVRDVRRDGDFISATIVVQSKKGLSAIHMGLRELSCGYNCDVEHRSGEYRGQRYDAIQRNIRYNHVSIVGQGRAGKDVRLKM